MNHCPSGPWFSGSLLGLGSECGHAGPAGPSAIPGVCSCLPGPPAAQPQRHLALASSLPQLPGALELPGLLQRQSGAPLDPPSSPPQQGIWKPLPGC